MVVKMAWGFMAGMFHLFTHAFFKALLFLGAGALFMPFIAIIRMIWRIEKTFAHYTYYIPYRLPCNSRVPSSCGFFQQR